MTEAAVAAQPEVDQPEVPANAEGEEEIKADQEGDDMGDAEEEEEEEEEGEETFINNHDLIGVKGIIEHQRNEIEKKKVSLE